MKFAACLCLALAGCTSPPPPVTTAASVVPDASSAVSYLAGGCFWGVEHFLEKLDGVASVDSGYMGGTMDHPSYRDVALHRTDHIETVRVRYDPKRVSYEAVTKRFLEIHDPTQADGQGPDIGPQYQSVIFYGSPTERTTAQTLIDRLRARGYSVVTQLRPADTFWPAEAAHQDYYAKTGKVPYCHAPVNRFGAP